MSASTLRAAAALIRLRAGVATPSPWEPYPDERGISDVVSPFPERAYSMLNEGTLGAVASSAYDHDAMHIASWHPAVALAVADLIDTVLKVGPVDGGAEWGATVNLANAYLGVTRMSNVVTVVRSLLHPQTLAFIIPAAICYLAVQFTEAHQHIEQQILMAKRETAQRLAKDNDQ